MLILSFAAKAVKAATPSVCSSIAEAAGPECAQSNTPTCWAERLLFSLAALGLFFWKLPRTSPLPVWALAWLGFFPFAWAEPGVSGCLVLVFLVPVCNHRFVNSTSSAQKGRTRTHKPRNIQDAMCWHADHCYSFVKVHMTCHKDVANNTQTHTHRETHKHTHTHAHACAHALLALQSLAKT